MRYISIHFISAVPGITYTGVTQYVFLVRFSHDLPTVFAQHREVGKMTE